MKAFILTALFTFSAWGHVVPGVTDVRIITRDGKKVELLTNTKGFSLYTFDPDSVDSSNCYDGCAKTWPPILLTAAQATSIENDNEFHVAKRKDGTLQLSFDGHPLYLYVGDKKPGDEKGDGLGGVWHLAIDAE